MSIISRIKEKYRKRNKLFLTVDIILTILTTYFAVRLLFTSISGLMGDSSTDAMNGVLFFWMILCLGLTYAVRVVEMLVYGKEEYFLLDLFTAIFALGVSVYIGMGLYY